MELQLRFAGLWARVIAILSSINKYLTLLIRVPNHSVD